MGLREPWRFISLASLLGFSQVASEPQVFSGTHFAGDSHGGTRIRAVSWNVAAVNNNPFEYWITHPDPAYKQLMQSVEQFITNPGADDVRVDELFTDGMFRRVLRRMQQAGLAELATVEVLWADYRARRIVSGFLLDTTIGKKRLASMPDRVTNTIQLRSGKSLFRPTVVNCYTEELGSMEEWFEKWLSFFFEQVVDLDGKGDRPVYTLLQPIRKSKYPFITEAESAASVPLQLVMQGIFDAILVNLMQTKGGSSWQPLRRQICESLNNRKNSRIMEILRTTYEDADVVFLQEAGNQLVELFREQYANSHHLVLSRSYSTRRNQNSVMLLRASMFSTPTEVEVAAEGWDAGDLLLVSTSLSGLDIALASFHGDTNGLLTAPMIVKVSESLPCKRFIFGLDANTYERPSDHTFHVVEFERMYQKLGFHASWGMVDPTRYTTFNARTYLQPQLNKAAKSTELTEKGDRNPKDFLLFTRHFEVGGAWRDNTGRGEYVEDMVFPTMKFPSDHAVIAADLLMSPPSGADGSEL